MTHIDERLVSKLSSAANNEKIMVIVKFDLQSEDLVQKALFNITNKSGQKPTYFKYYDKLGFLLLEATSEFIQNLIKSPNISTIALAKSDDFYRIG